MKRPLKRLLKRQLRLPNEEIAEAPAAEAADASGEAVAEQSEDKNESEAISRDR